MKDRGLFSRSRPRRAALAAFGAVVALAGSEALLRAAYLSPGQYRLDPVLGVDRPPHSEVFVAREGGARLRFDRYGFNNDDAIWERAGPRLAVLGDSFIEASELPREENAVSRLAAAFPGLVVLNLGRAGATLMQSVELFHRVAERERIELLLFAFSENHLRTLAEAPPTGPDCRMPERSFSPAQRLRAELVGQSALLVRMHQRVRDWMRDPGLPSSTPPGPDGPDRSVKPGMVSQLAACLLVLAEGRPTAVALLPNSDLPVTERRRASDHELLGVYRQAAQRAGLPVIDAWTAFGADPFGDGRLVNGFPNAVLGRGHLNALGHARLAEVLAQGAAQALPRPGQAPLVALGRGGAP